MFKHVKARKCAVATAGLLLASLLLPTTAGAVTTVLRAPVIPGVAPVPGAVASAAQPSLTMGLLNVTPDQGLVGTPVTISGTHLRANTSVELTWSTANVTWVLDPEPDTVNYLGRAETKFAVVLRTVTTNAKGSFSVALKVPAAWGGVHRRALNSFVAA